MRGVSVVVLVVLMLTATSVMYSAEVDDSWRDAVRQSSWLVNGQCTGVAVAPQRILTASHCVGRPGDTVSLAWMQDRRQTRVGTVRYDAPWIDYACVRLFHPVRRRYWGAGGPPASRGDRLWAYTASLGCWGGRLTPRWRACSSRCGRVVSGA